MATSVAPLRSSGRHDRNRWSTSAEYANKVSSSNLFTQLYYKQRLTKMLKTGGIASLKKGVQFRDVFTKTERKIGSNAVVLKAVEKLKGYLDNSFYVALVPDSDKNLRDFFNKVFSIYSIDELAGWEIDFWGYLSWEKVEEYCRQNRMEETLKVFEFNKGQIY